MWFFNLLFWGSVFQSQPKQVYCANIDHHSLPELKAKLEEACNKETDKDDETC